ncbi:hypothetical protein CK203_061954 [Vitis vinifera]|nr:hypothetical protein CK203_061954 [Vitis vinifera]
MLHVNGTSKSFDFRVGIILQASARGLLEQAIQLNFSASNNEVEYEAILVGLDLALTMTMTKLEICNDSQLIIEQIQKEYAPIPRMHSEVLNLVTSPWLFTQWGMDIVDLLPIATTQKRFLLVATNYFSKWVEANAYVSIKDKDVSKFVWKNIVCRLRVPRAIIADNEP